MDKSVRRNGCMPDGCLYIHNHTINGKQYNNIGFCFSSKSKKLIISVAGILNEFKITPHITNTENNIYLYSQKAVEYYLDIFGSSNSRILNVYSKWVKTKQQN